MSETNFADYLHSLNACPAAIEWVGTQTREKAWANCKRSDWMLWLLRVEGKTEKIVYVRLAVAFARRVSHLNDDPRAEAALRAAEAVLENDTPETRASLAAATPPSTRSWAATPRVAAAEAMWAAEAAAAEWVAVWVAMGAEAVEAERAAQADIIRAIVG